MRTTADRTVSVEVRAKLSGFEKLKAAEQNAASLSRQMISTGASAQAMRQRLEAATKALPKIAIDADSTAAEIKFAEVRAELEKLSGKRIGIDVDAGVAKAQIEELTRELEALARNEPDVNVRADIGEAIAQLQLVNREVDRVDGRTARVNVNADAGGALASIATVGAALAALPAMTTVAVSVAALGGAFTVAGIGAAAFSAAAVPALGRINQALTAQESAAKGAGAATGGAGQSAAQAAQQAMQLEQAESRLKQAQTDRKQAQEDLTRAVEDGRRALQDQNAELRQSVLSQKDADLAVREAEARLAELQSKGGASSLEVERAMLSVDQAHERAREQEIKTQRAKKDTAAANLAGVKGTQEYQRGLDGLRQAEQKVQQASDQLKIAHLQQQAAMSGGGGGAAKLKDAFADLSAQEKVLAKDIKGFKDEYVAWQRSLEPDTFPVIAQGMDLLRLGMKDAAPLAKTAASAFLTLGKDAEASLRGPFWGEFLFDVNTQMPNAIVGLGHSFGNVVTGIAGVVDAFLPFTGTVVGGLESATKAWSDWGQELQDSPEFHEFILFAKENAPAVWQVVKDLAGALKNVGESVAPLGVGAFSGLGLLARIVKDMDPEQIRAIALAILAIKGAQAGLKIASFFTDFVSKVGDLKSKVAGFGDSVDKVKTKASGLKGAVSGLADSFGGLSGLVGGTAIAGGLLILDQRFADAAKSAGQYTEKIQASAGTNIDNELAALNQELKTQTDLQGPNIASWIYFTDAGKTAGDRMDALRDRIADLTHQKELAAIQAKVAGGAISTMGGQANTSAGQVGGLDKSLGAFAARTDALQATRNMASAFKEARDAIDAANGKLQISAGMTDKQRDAVIQAREKFAEYISSVKTAADGAKTLGGNTFDATRAVLEQLPHLGSLAGKNKEAKDQVLLLAAAYGISKSDAEKAMKSADGLREVLAKLKSKEIKIGLTMDVSAAEKEFGSFIARYSNKSLAIALATKVKAAGGIQTAAGVDLMAAGGIKPNIATSATYLPASGTVYAEAGKEAFIPYDSAYRERAISILGQVAQDFGLAVFNPQAEQQVTDLVAGLNMTNTSITVNLADATRQLDSTLGASGTLTQQVSAVGVSAQGVGNAVVGVNSAIGISSDMIVKSTDKLGTAALTVADVVAKAAQAILSAASASGGSGKGSQGSTNVPAPGSSKGSGKGSQGSVIPPAPPAPKVITVGAGQVASLPGMSAPSMTNYSRVSAPQPAPSSYAGSGGGAGGGAASDGAPASGTTVNKNVNFYGTTVREGVDVEVLFRKASMYVDSRG